jgi:hypothetical protein
MVLLSKRFASLENRPAMRDGAVLIMRGREPLYTAEIAEGLLGQLSGGRSLRAVCRDQGMPPHGTVLQWVRDDREGFAARYRRAREIGNARTGRPPLYTAEIARRILDGVSDGRKLAEICSEPGMPSCNTVRQWATDDREGFAARYSRAREIGHAKPCPRSTYAANIADLILDELLGGRTLAGVCRDPGMPAYGAVRHWASDNREGFAARFREARDIGYQVMADQILDIADDSRGDWIVRRKKDGTTEWVVDHENIRRSRLRVNARRWLLSNALARSHGGLLNLFARHEASSDISASMKAIDGRTRGLPNAGRLGKKSETE